MKKNPKKDTNKKIFKPVAYLFIDAILIVDILILAAHGVTGISVPILLTASILIDIPIFLIWLVIAHFLKVEIADNIIKGPSVFWAKQSIPLRKIDHTRITSDKRSRMVKDLWSVEGTRVRLYRLFLGRPQICEIMNILQKHPFRETGQPQPKIPETKGESSYEY